MVRELAATDTIRARQARPEFGKLIPTLFSLLSCDHSDIKHAGVIAARMRIYGEKIDGLRGQLRKDFRWIPEKRKPPTRGRGLWLAFPFAGIVQIKFCGCVLRPFSHSLRLTPSIVKTPCHHFFFLCFTTRASMWKTISSAMFLVRSPDRSRLRTISSSVSIRSTSSGCLAISVAVVLSDCLK